MAPQVLEFKEAILDRELNRFSLPVARFDKNRLAVDRFHFSSRSAGLQNAPASVCAKGRQALKDLPGISPALVRGELLRAKGQPA